MEYDRPVVCILNRTFVDSDGLAVSTTCAVVIFIVKVGCITSHSSLFIALIGQLSRDCLSVKT